MVAVAAVVSSALENGRESHGTTLTIAPISEAPVRQGEEDLRPVLVAPGLYGEWTLACWGGRDWYDQHSGRVLKPAVYCRLPGLASITTS